MNKLILISIALLTSCSLFNDPEPISVTSTLGPNDVYNLAGGTGLELTQAGIVNLVTVPASVEGTSFVIPLPSCLVYYDVAIRDPSNYVFWLSQPLTVNYDPGLVSCVNATSCRIDPLSVEMVGTIATAIFSCD